MYTYEEALKRQELRKALSPNVLTHQQRGFSKMMMMMNTQLGAKAFAVLSKKTEELST